MQLNVYNRVSLMDNNRKKDLRERTGDYGSKRFVCVGCLIGGPGFIIAQLLWAQQALASLVLAGGCWAYTS